MNSIIVWPDMSSKFRFQVHYGDYYISKKINYGVVAKMASHAIFQYNILVIDIDNITLGLI